MLLLFYMFERWHVCRWRIGNNDCVVPACCVGLLDVWEHIYSTSRPVSVVQPDGSSTCLAHLVHMVMPHHFPEPISSASRAAAAGHPAAAATATAAVQQGSIAQVEQLPQEPQLLLPKHLDEQEQQQCQGATAADVTVDSSTTVVADQGGGTVSSMNAPQEAIAEGTPPADARDDGPARGLQRHDDDSSADGNNANKDSSAHTAAAPSTVQAPALEVGQLHDVSQPADVSAPQVMLPPTGHLPRCLCVACRQTGVLPWVGYMPTWVQLIVFFTLLCI